MAGTEGLSQACGHPPTPRAPRTPAAGRLGSALPPGPASCLHARGAAEPEAGLVPQTGLPLACSLRPGRPWGSQKWGWGAPGTAVPHGARGPVSAAQVGPPGGARRLAMRGFPELRGFGTGQGDCERKFPEWSDPDLDWGTLSCCRPSPPCLLLLFLSALGPSLRPAPQVSPGEPRGLQPPRSGSPWERAGWSLMVTLEMGLRPGLPEGHYGDGSAPGAPCGQGLSDHRPPLTKLLPPQGTPPSCGARARRPSPRLGNLASRRCW